MPPPEAPSEKYKPGEEAQASHRTNGMLEVPGGSYKIGTDNQIIPADREGPAKLVELPTFYLFLSKKKENETITRKAICSVKKLCSRPRS